MGGGTGTGASPIVAQIAREAGSVDGRRRDEAVPFEGNKRRIAAEEGIANLKQHVDTLIRCPMTGFCRSWIKRCRFSDAFRLADDVLRQGIQGISDLITVPGLINLDFADVKTIMSTAGSALMAIGEATGDTRSLDAAHLAIASPLLDIDISGARGVLFNITGGMDLSLFEVNEAADMISKAAHPEANIIFGAVQDPTMMGRSRLPSLPPDLTMERHVHNQRHHPDQLRIMTAASSTMDRLEPIVQTMQTFQSVQCSNHRERINFLQ